MKSDTERSETEGELERGGLTGAGIKEVGSCVCKEIARKNGRARNRDRKERKNGRARRRDREERMNWRAVKKR